jgi:hypothetical protein
MAVGFEDELIDIKGEVVYCREGMSGMFESGVRFLETDERMNKIIEALVASFNRGENQE